MKNIHYLATHGDLTKVEEYLKSINVKSEKGVVALTTEQHRIIHKLEGKRFS